MSPVGPGGPPPGGGYVWDPNPLRPRWVKKPKANPQAGIGAFTPFAPMTPAQLPGGTYDVSLDSQLRGGERGFAYLQADAERQGARSSDDFQRQTAQTREDHQLSTAELARRFGVLGRSQYQAARATGVARGGALVEALQKRTENQGRDQSQLDLGRDRQLGALALAFARDTEDRATGVSRAGSELGFLRGDIGAVKLQQAKDSGFELPTRPAGESVSPGGTPYRTFKGNLGTTWYILPDGRVTKTKPR